MKCIENLSFTENGLSVPFSRKLEVCKSSVLRKISIDETIKYPFAPINVSGLFTFLKIIHKWS